MKTDAEVRDQFAGFALQLLIAKHPAEIVTEDEHNIITKMVARGAYKYADAMMEARKEQPK